MKNFVVLFIVIGFFGTFHGAASHSHNKSGGNHCGKKVQPTTTKIAAIPYPFKILLDSSLKALVEILRYLLSVVFKNLFNVLNNVVSTKTKINVNNLIALLNTLKDPTLSILITEILKFCEANDCIISKLIPCFILNTEINVDAFIKLFQSQCKSTNSVTLALIFNVISDYLVNVYSIRLY